MRDPLPEEDEETAGQLWPYQVRELIIFIGHINRGGIELRGAEAEAEGEADEDATSLRLDQQKQQRQGKQNPE